MSFMGHAASMEESRNTNKIQVRKLKGKRPVGRPVSTWEVSFKMDM
jgi:hypothetical protein